MTKQELMETYTAEQLAEMVIKADSVLNMIKYSDSFLKSGLFDNPAVAAYESKLSIMQHENDKLKYEVEKYRKAFEDTKKECDCQIAEYQKKIDELEYDLKTAGEKIQDLAGENMKLQCERNDYKTKSEFLEIERMRVKKNEFTDFLPTEPIKAADVLINAEIEPIETNSDGMKIVYKQRNFKISELRQIAEHLLVYCNHNGEAEE